jgi:hypothetical protein
VLLPGAGKRFTSVNMLNKQAYFILPAGVWHGAAEGCCAVTVCVKNGLNCFYTQAKAAVILT